MAGYRNTGIALVCAALGMLACAGAFAQDGDEPFAFVQPYTIHTFAAAERVFEAGARDFIPGIDYKVADISSKLSAQRGELTGIAPTLKDEITALSFLYTIQVLHRAGDRYEDITDFTQIPGKGGDGAIQTIFGIRLTFAKGIKVPDTLLMFGEKEATTIDTHGDSVNVPAFRLTLTRHELPNKTVVLIIHVYKWPAGDPRMGG
jgi:hypothetical protein